MRISDWSSDVCSSDLDCGYRLHQNLGPGLLESAYEAILADQLVRRGLYVERQKPIPIRYDGLELAEGFRADLMLEGKLLVELKSVERLSPLHSKQVLTYLRSEENKSDLQSLMRTSFAVFWLQK